MKGLTSHKEKKGEKVEKYFLKEKNNLKKLEREAFLKCGRLSIYNQISSQNFEYYDLENDTKIETDNLKTNFSQSTQSYF